MITKIGKYAFNSKEQAQSKINALGVETDEDGNSYPTHYHTVVELGLEPLSETTFDEEGNVLEEATYGTKYLIDVLWCNLEADEDGNITHPSEWESFSVDIDGEGIHGFLGLDYQSNKI
jgi:hypothetical protein